MTNEMDAMSENRVITVVTSCGKTFVQAVRDMSDRQLTGLVEGNGDRTDLDAADLADLAAMRDELRRRAEAAAQVWPEVVDADDEWPPLVVTPAQAR